MPPGMGESSKAPRPERPPDAAVLRDLSPGLEIPIQASTRKRKRKASISEYQGSSGAESTSHRASNPRKSKRVTASDPSLRGKASGARGAGPKVSTDGEKKKECTNEWCQTRMRGLAGFVENIHLHWGAGKMIYKAEKRARERDLAAWQLERAALLSDKAAAEDREQRVKLDALRDRDHESEKRKLLEAKLQKAQFDLRMSERHVGRITDFHEKEVRRLQLAKMQDIEDLRTLNYQAQQDAALELGKWRSEVDHLQDVMKGMQSDLMEMCRIKNEESAQRMLDNRGLPPAYGNLDDDENLPPYDRYEDSGVPDKFEDIIRLRFDQVLALAVHDHTSLLIENHPMAREEFAARAVAALACASRLAQQLHKSIEKASVAASVTNLLIELAWRALAAIEAMLHCNEPDRMTLMLHFSEVDDALVVLIRASFAERVTLNDLAHYNSQLERLGEGFRSSFPKGPAEYFALSKMWLDDQICKEREVCANRIQRNAGRRREAAAAATPDD